MEALLTTAPEEKQPATEPSWGYEQGYIAPPMAQPLEVSVCPGLVLPQAKALSIPCSSPSPPSLSPSSPLPLLPSKAPSLTLGLVPGFLPIRVPREVCPSLSPVVALAVAVGLVP